MEMKINIQCRHIRRCDQYLQRNQTYAHVNVVLIECIIEVKKHRSDGGFYNYYTHSRTQTLVRQIDLRLS